MPSDKSNSTTKSMGSLINVASSRDVLFCQPQQLQCSHHEAYPCFPLFSIPFSSSAQVTICGSTLSQLHGRPINCNDCRSVHHAIILLKTFCKMIETLKTKGNHPFAVSLRLGVHAVTSEYSIFPYSGKKRYLSCSSCCAMGQAYTNTKLTSI